MEKRHDVRLRMLLAQEVVSISGVVSEAEETVGLGEAIWGDGVGGDVVGGVKTVDLAGMMRGMAVVRNVDGGDEEW